MGSSGFDVDKFKKAYGLFVFSCGVLILGLSVLFGSYDGCLWGAGFLLCGGFILHKKK